MTLMGSREYCLVYYSGVLLPWYLLGSCLLGCERSVSTVSVRDK